MVFVYFQRSRVSRVEQLICKFEQLLYLLVIVPMIAFLPAPLAYGIACRRGDWAYRHDASTREEIMRNLESVIGDQMSDTERAQVARGFFRRRSCEALDMMRLAGRGRWLARLVEIRGLEHIEAALAAGKGAILCSAHYGFFNGCFSLLAARGFPITVVGEQPSRSTSNMSLVERLFWRFGVEKRVARYRRRPNIEPGRGQVEAAIQIVEILRSNEVIGIAIDVSITQEERQRAVAVDFLGRQILLLPGSVTLAQMTGSQVLSLVVRRSSDWRHQSVEISPVPMNGDAESVFKRCVALVEAPIQQNPAYWNGWENSQNLDELGLL